MNEDAIPARRRSSKASVFRGGAGNTPQQTANVRPLVALQPLTVDSSSTGDDPQPATQQRTPRRRTAPKPGKAAGEGGTASSRKVDVPIATRVPVSLIKQLNAHRQTTGMTSVKVMFHALVDTLDRLPDLLRQDTQEQEKVTETIGMFDLGTTTAPKEREVQRMWRVSEKNAAMIDELVASTGATSRQQLLRVALTTYLASSPTDEP